MLLHLRAMMVVPAEWEDLETLIETIEYEIVSSVVWMEMTTKAVLAVPVETVNDYIDALNANGTWVTYDSMTNTVSLTGIDDFVKAFKSASKNLGAFDQLDAGQGENVLFGYGDGAGAHFDAMLSGILDGLNNEYAPDFTADLQKTDSAGYTVRQRHSAERHVAHNRSKSCACTPKL